ncbi:LPS O-antigen chain length determinant protein WzzB [Allopusillimonas ginsengisoli]|uniref:LPS O-antigen chain length determinant protein WzzB n=1 Tax=Allopusillimonas ginsengisoli TaxID=453575 RepID=UPI0039C1F876
MSHSAPYTNPPDDAIDLRELFRTIWASRLLIVITTFVVTCIAVAYAFLATPIYETHVSTLPPTSAGLARYNVGSQLTGGAINSMLRSTDTAPAAGIRVLDPKDAYRAFLVHLTSESVRQEFFQKFYLPAHDGHASEQALQRKLNRELTFKLPVKQDEFVATVTMRGTDPTAIANWTNEYVELAIDMTRKDLVADLAGDVQVRLKGVTDQIKALRKIAEIARADRITRLSNALDIAQSIGLEVPLPGSPLITIGGNANSDVDAISDGNMMYLRGAKALQSELELLKQRKNDDAYVPELTDLLRKQVLLNSIDLETLKPSVAIIDRAAVAPENPVRPKKVLILALGVILGGILGLILVIGRRALK